MLKKFTFDIKRKFSLFSILILLALTFLTFANQLNALNNSQGEKIFVQHCSGCHINGGNIIRRSKTLKIFALKRNGFDSPEAIAKVARDGYGIMNGYGKVLMEEEDIIVANWIWEQSQKDWFQG